MRNRLSFLVATTVLVTACADMSTPSTPSSSTTTTTQSSPVPGSSNKGGNNNQTGRVELNGIVTGLGGQCPAISFSVSGSPVMTSATTTFDDGACSTIKNGDQLEVEGVKQANNVVMASRVEKKNADDVDDDDDDNPNVPGRVELKGMVAGRTGACPSITFSVGSSTVMTNASTTFDDGTCSTVQNGDQVEVEGVRQANGVVLASRVEKKNQDNDDDEDDDNDNRHGGEARLEGTIGGFGGACPSVTFTVSGSTVSTSASTRFDDACGSLKNGDRVEVKGIRQTNNVVAASRVEKKK